MLKVSRLDLAEIATALQDQTVYEYRWLIDPRSGQISVWTEDGGIDGRTPVDLDEVGLLPIEPLPSWAWYQDMVDFAEGISDERAGRGLARPSRARARSAGSKTACTRTTRSCCPHGTRSAPPSRTPRSPVAGRQTRSSTTPPRVP